MLEKCRKVLKPSNYPAPVHQHQYDVEFLILQSKKVPAFGIIKTSFLRDLNCSFRGIDGQAFQLLIILKIQCMASCTTTHIQDFAPAQFQCSLFKRRHFFKGPEEVSHRDDIIFKVWRMHLDFCFIIILVKSLDGLAEYILIFAQWKKFLIV